MFNTVLEIVKALWKNKEEIILVYQFAVTLAKEIEKLYKDGISKKNSFNKKLDDHLFEKGIALPSRDKNMIRELAVKAIENGEE